MLNFLSRSVEVCNLERYMSYFIYIRLVFACRFERYFFYFCITTKIDTFDSTILYIIIIMAYMGILNGRGLIYNIFKKGRHG